MNTEEDNAACAGQRDERIGRSVVRLRAMEYLKNGYKI